MNEKLIQNIYERTISYVLEGIEEEYISEISNMFFSKLKNIYSDVNISNDDFSQVCEKMSEYEINKWKSKSVDSKKIELLNDENFNVIGSVSSKALKFAEKRLSENIITISQNEANEYIKQMEEHLSLVLPFNKNLARIYVSEGTMDLLFASGVTENTSLRIGRMR